MELDGFNTKLPGVNLTPILKGLPQDAINGLIKEGHWTNPNVNSIFAKCLGVSEEALKNAKFIPLNGAE